jgi:beta-lactamase class D
MACSPGTNTKNQAGNQKEERRITVQVFQNILDSARVSGAILVYDPREETYYSNDFARCSEGHLPASTFKIPNSIIALETGIVENDSTILPWDGKKRRLPAWEKDLLFRDAFHVSCVPCYQEIARKIGPDRMKDYLEKLDYGRMLVDSATIDLFWLEGESRISQFQQVDFLFRFYYSKLPIKSLTEEIMKRLMVIEKNSTFSLSGKTGWSIRNGNNNGWFVGYLEKGQKVCFIATNIDPEADFNMDLFTVIRKQISMEAFRALGILSP